MPPPTAATPKFSLPAGKYTTKQVVSLLEATPGSTIYYTLDGSAPSTSSLQYSAQISITGNLTIEAIAVAPGYSTSGLGRADYSIVAPTGASVPANATKVNNTQLMPNWRIKHDTATPGTSTCAMAVVSDPSLSGQAQQFYTTYTNVRRRTVLAHLRERFASPQFRLRRTGVDGFGKPTDQSRNG